MKRILILFFSLYFGANASGQSSFDALLPSNFTIITQSSQDYIDFSNSSTLYSNSVYSLTDYKLYNVSQRNLRILESTIQNSRFNRLITYLNYDTKESISYLLIIETERSVTNTQVFDSTGSPLYNTNVSGNSITFDNLALNEVNNRGTETPFWHCMQVKQNEFEQTFSGWILWNTSGVTAVTAAVFCQGCAKHWWSGGCPS